jgi:hypothetical protein
MFHPWCGLCYVLANQVQGKKIQGKKGSGRKERVRRGTWPKACEKHAKKRNGKFHAAIWR